MAPSARRTHCVPNNPYLELESFLRVFRNLFPELKNVTTFAEFTGARERTFFFLA